MRKLYALLLLVLFNQVVMAQKTVTLQDCESQFLKNNLFLLASHYNIDAAKAMTIQARIWDNPNLTAELNAYNPERDKFFDIGKQGQKVFGIEQLIYLGGKKRNEVKLAKTNEQLAELQFNDLLRTLKLQLRQSFYTVYYNTKSLEITDKQLVHIEDLINSYSIQAQKGNIPLRDVVRLQSLYLNFKNERMEVVNNSIEEQANLKLLLNSTETIIPDVSKDDFNKYLKIIPFDLKSFEDEAIANRPDYLAKQKEIEANELNVKWQKSLSVPDITLGANYDQRSGAFNNEANISVGIPLPLWNKNKGNIKNAQAVLAQSKVEKQNFNLQLETEITSAWNKWDESRKNYAVIKPTVNSDFEAVYNGILTNFQKRNISLLEFTDFMESYNQANIQVNELKKKLALSGEELNTTINKDLF
ncbi:MULTISPECIES: TolC family protein [Flavobacterium]|jgi:cobalt-zinc-cadmium efflux system outer membrane protein|uniref:Outer membrane efflux protein n=1 Tax=Flavobacterium johnsoniae (strain ATCC 17061 / DSM 2064 / JCM 8514 / BCRC 14874 / CCUG 350202 / NBRC 14942 / NCIMB 11054 / UW101) TaxID=376686 RepID=A5FGB1_FLAJ1|nr:MULTISPECIES: TolC family protein [Flavobacterium]ABQ05755.1 outer membrane efflux protein [Flavobacterium johnsoniae UW101]WDF57526.1 TolC family protein [Flavobacterium sp. KACC 22758]WQG81491.1 TolC family protein [Flavobacterium johnsoniae UW101]SHM05882.1 outer membrane protein, cobalt-zinc-cadmium efflux system [Flavobacterium johnsoniae]